MRDRVALSGRAWSGRGRLSAGSWFRARPSASSQRRAQKGAAFLESASAIRPPERMSREAARRTRSRGWRRLQPPPVARAMARRAMCISW